jgi:hypothetical protein
MEQRFVVFRFLFPADENPPKAIHPRGNTLNDPAAGTPPATFRDLFLAARLDVGSVATPLGFAADGVRIEPFVAAEMLASMRGWTRAANRNAIERRAKESLVMRVGAGNRQADGHPSAIGQHRTLDAQLSSIRGVFPGFFPRPREPWWSIRRDFATSIECPGGHHTVAAGTSRACGTHGVASTPGSIGAASCRSRTPWEPLSIGSRSARRRKCRRPLVGFPAVADHPGETCDTWARTAPCEPKGRRGYANSDTTRPRAYENPP